MSGVDNFNKFKNGVNVKNYKKLKQAGTLILQDADKIIPIDTGFLANSKFQKENLNPDGFDHVHKNDGLSAKSKVKGSWFDKFKRKKEGFVPVKNNIVPFEKTKNELGDFSQDDVDRYMKEMYSTKTKSGDSRGFRTIGGNIGVDAKTAEKIHGYLCTRGIIKVIGSRTRILKEVV
jgi:hypothetical protein